MGGFRSAEFSFYATFAEANAWLSSGLASEVVARNEFGTVVWNGFVNQITLSNGASTREIGPVLDIDNNVACSYSTPDWEGLVISQQLKTAFVSDVISVSKYGELSAMVSGGTKETKEAIAFRDKHLAENSQPYVIDTTETMKESSKYEITVQCAGWTRYLEKTVYNYTASTAKQTVSAKFDNMWNRTNLSTSAYIHRSKIVLGISGTVSGYEDRDRSVWDIITDMVDSLGYTNMTCGAFDDRVLIIDSVSGVYTRDIATGRMFLGGNSIPNSAVRPGYRVSSSGIGGAGEYFIDSVSYDANDDKVSINSVKRSAGAVLKRIYGAY